jgi:hypothetical protein
VPLSFAFRLLAFLAVALEELRAGFIVLNASGTYCGPLLLGVELPQRASRVNKERFDFSFVLRLLHYVKGKILDFRLMSVSARPESIKDSPPTDVSGISHRVMGQHRLPVCGHPYSANDCLPNRSLRRESSHQRHGTTS